MGLRASVQRMCCNNYSLHGRVQPQLEWRVGLAGYAVSRRVEEEGLGVNGNSVTHFAPWVVPSTCYQWESSVCVVGGGGGGGGGGEGGCGGVRWEGVILY